MNSLLPPLGALLLKWTILLALAWIANWRLRQRHPRWRLILWRCVLGCGFFLPLTAWLPLPRVPIPLDRFSLVAPRPPEGVPPPVPTTAANSNPKAARFVPAIAASTGSVAAVTPRQAAGAGSASTRPVWKNTAVLLWAVGAALAAGRLLRIQFRLGQIRRASLPADPRLQRELREIQAGLGVPRALGLRVSESVSSPFACGLLQPAILLPRRLAQELPADEMVALLAHEVAHFRRHDLFWCVGWRWMQALCWFHPLVWRLPAAHGLACEQEADRVASGRLTEQSLYPRLLARLALRVRALPAVETQLAVNAGAQITQRLLHLQATNPGVWRWIHSAAGFASAGALCLLVTSCEFSAGHPPGTKATSAVEFKKMLVVVQDEHGQPVEGATITPDGFRVKGRHEADAYSWNRELFGPPERAVTDHEGKAYVKYPVEGIPEEKEFTGKLVFSVSHPEFGTVRPQEYSVDSPEAPIRLTRGIHLALSGYTGGDHQLVKELVPNLNEEMIRPEDWIKDDRGIYAFHKMSPGGHLVQLMGRLPSGEIVFSDSRAFTAEPGRNYEFSLELKPGIRLEGRLDDRVPRPVKHGRALISLRPAEFPAWNNYAEVDDVLKQYPNYHAWKSYRPIAEDGTFVFEAIPPGGLDVVVHGDGFASQSGGEFSERVNSQLVKVPGFALPQAFDLKAPVTKIEVVTESTATLELTARTPEGKPVAGASVYVNPNVVRMGGIFGDMEQSSESPFRTLAVLPDVPYSATSDQTGRAIIRNVPASDRGIEVFHPHFQVPLQEPKGWRDRHLRTAFTPGATNRFLLTLEPKGSTYIGTAK